MEEHTVGREIEGRLDSMQSLTRRDFFGTAAAAAFVLGFRVPIGEANAAASDPSSFVPNAFIRIDPQGSVTLTIPQVEMGQGTYTSLAMILAEELDAAWSSVRVEHAPADNRYINPILTFQGTGNSNSVRAFYKPLREAGAIARACLIEAAGMQWQVPVSECRTEDGRVFHVPSKQSLDYGALTQRAASLTPPKRVALKDVNQFRLIGQPLKRLDAAAKVNGTASFGIDARPEGVLIATLMKSPVLGGKVASADDKRTRQIAGVRQVVVLDDLVAVVGDHMWAAKRGLEALDVVWRDGPNAAVSSDVIWSRLRSASKRDGAVAEEIGNPGATFASANTAQIMTAEYELPLLAHACLEPLNCTVHVRATSAEAWIGTQVMQHVRAAVAKGANIPEAQVTVHNHLIGGGFGRRLEPDMAYDAARIARHVNRPVKVVWSREEDIRHDIYRPVYHNSLSACLRDNRIAGWKHKISGSSIFARYFPPVFKNGVDPDGVDSAEDLPYDIPNLRVEFNQEEPPGVNTGFWRGVGPNNAVFAIESFIDELARKAGQDPIEFRRAHLGNSPRLLTALNLVREKSEWGSKLPQRCGRGVAVQNSFGSFIATVVECKVSDDGEIELRRVTSAVDTGLAINPDTIVAQLQGGLIFGLTAALYGEITLKNGRVQQSNFHDYQLLRINQVPPIEVHVIKSAEAPGGIGETGTVAATPALRNAIYAATGVALRRMPIDRSKLAVRGATPSA